MSDTENKSENATDTKAVDTAPYLKKDKANEAKAESSKNNVIIPLVLLLVSAIVIVATFYGDEYNDLLAQADSQETVPEKIAEAATEANTETTAQVESTEVKAEQDQPATISEPAVTTAQTETTNTVETVAVQAAVQATVQAEKTAAAAVAAPVSKTTKPVAQATMQQANFNARRVNAPYQHNAYNRQQAEKMAKQHMEMIQQRRQAYEKEMQARRVQYEAAMKAQQEKRANMAAAQKAVFQRAQQSRIETNKKIQEIYNKISKLHEEIHQLMMESRRTGAPVQMQTM